MLCPLCDEEIEVRELKESRTYTYKGVKVVIEDRFHRCPLCKVEWSVDGFDYMAEVISQFDCLTRKSYTGY